MKKFIIFATYLILLHLIGPNGFSYAYAQNSSQAVPLIQPDVPFGWSEIRFEESASEPQFNALDRSRGYILFRRPITESVYPNSKPRAYERVEVLTTFATPGEFEPITFAIYPLRDVKNVSVHCSDLVFGNERIPASAISVRLVTYWNIRYPQYTSNGTYRKLPELLEKVGAYSSPQGECQRWWIITHVPPDAKPGLYHGNVTIQEDGRDKKAEVPIQFRVMGFTLQHDPSKRLSAYYYPRNPFLYQGQDKATIDSATADEYKSMVDYGFNMFPTFQLTLDNKTNCIVIQHEDEIARMRSAGLSGPLPVDGADAIERIIQLVMPNFVAQSHWNNTRDIPPEVFSLIEQKFRDFKAECQRQGLPQVTCCPLDEVSSGSQDFGVNVFAALKRAGMRTYITKNPVAPDARPYAPFVDIWCSQPFALPYQNVIASKEHEYWCYPNHNSGELKDRDIMCKGGRMTYGYGFWRSGYTTLIPWHWSWVMEPGPLDYLRSRYSGCGQRIDNQGKVIPTIYWECFREGYDDSRYLYSLQLAAWERDGTDDPHCQTLVDAAKGLLREIWDSIEVQDRYLSANLWPSIEFDARRWQMAVLIEQLQQYPQLRQGEAPSVYIREVRPSVFASPREETLESDNVEIRELVNEPQKWFAESDESKLRDATKANQPIGPLRWTVSIDHKSASTADGEHLMGWPRIRREFAKGELDFTQYDYLEINLQFDSSRDESQDNFTPLGLCFSSFASEKHFEFEHNLGDSQRQSLRLLFPVSELIDACGKGELPWRSIDYLQLFVSEANYPDELILTFEIQTIRLLRFKEPQIISVDLPRVFVLPSRYLPVQCDLVGVKSDAVNNRRLTAKVVDTSGAVVAESHVQVAKNCTIVLDTTNIKSGEYQLELATDRGPGSGKRIFKTFLCVDGPEITK